MIRFHIITIGLFVSLVSVRAQQPVAPDLESIHKQTIEAHVSFLASDALEGRQAGKNGALVAAEYIRAVLKELGVDPFYSDHFQTFEAYGPPRERRGRFQTHPDSIAKYKQLPFYRKLDLQNVLGYIEGENKDEYVVLGAHYDHLGKDEFLVGDQIYNGADDNASSVAAILQIAKTLAASGEKPARSIILAFWDGEEIGLLGSEYFVANFENIQDVKAYINLDMISREGIVPAFAYRSDTTTTGDNNAEGNQFHLLYTQPLKDLGEGLVNDIEDNTLAIQPRLAELPDRARGSDHAPFFRREVPILWFFTGLHPDYHTPGDEVHTIDLDKLTDITRATYISLWRLANE